MRLHFKLSLTVLAVLLSYASSNSLDIKINDVDPDVVDAVEAYIANLDSEQHSGDSSSDQAVKATIAYGSDASPGQFPSVAALAYSSSNGYLRRCDGTLIAPNLVLTAGHCVQDNVPSLVFLGATISEFAYNGSTNAQEIFAVNGYSVHPNYSEGNDDVINDIAMLRLNGESSLTPATLAQQQAPAGTVLTTAGFGADQNTPSTNQIPSNLMYTSITVSSTAPCPSSLSPGQYCTISGAEPNGGYSSSCEGDSGGPEFVANTNTANGITSWGPDVPCGAQKYGVSSSVAFYLNSYIIPTMQQFGVAVPSPPPPPPPPPLASSPPPTPGAWSPPPTPPSPDPPSPSPRPRPSPSPSPKPNKPKSACSKWVAIKLPKTKFTGASPSASSSAASFKDCRKSCIKDQVCLSFNYKKVGSKRTCFKFKESKRELQRVTGVTYYAAGYLACLQWKR